MRRSTAVWFASYGLSLLGKGIVTAVLPLLVLDRTDADRPQTWTDWERTAKRAQG